MRKTIFILEDDDDLRTLYGYIFADEDYDIITFASVKAFMEGSQQIPNLYLLDVMLPDGDGIMLCNQLKENPLTASVPVIMVSAHKDIEDVEHECPRAEFIAKPFDIEKLTNMVSKKINYVGEI